MRCCGALRLLGLPLLCQSWRFQSHFVTTKQQSLQLQPETRLMCSFVCMKEVHDLAELLCMGFLQQAS
jgi:hypothetical protein